jgi:hypothetical protein
LLTRCDLKAEIHVLLPGISQLGNQFFVGHEADFGDFHIVSPVALSCFETTFVLMENL